MKSRKNLKKQINESMGLLYNDCILYKVFTKEANIEKADALIEKIALAHTDLLSRVNSNEGKSVKNRIKTYYQKLNEDLRSQVNTFGKEIQDLD